jgi:hypothetical protein
MEAEEDEDRRIEKMIKGQGWGKGIRCPVK